MAEITRKSVLLECLSIMRQELALTSERYDGLIPKKGMEDAWAQCRQKIELLKDMIHAYESPVVRSALADWQKEIMERGGEPEAKMDGDFLAALDGLTPAQMEQLKRGEWVLNDGHKDENAADHPEER